MRTKNWNGKLIKKEKCGCPAIQTLEDNHVFGNLYLGIAFTLNDLCKKHRLKANPKTSVE